METDTMTMELEGKVSLDDFAEAMLTLKHLIRTLSMELNADGIDWMVDDLRTGSASASIRGTSQMPGEVEKVVRAVGIVGDSLASGTPMPYSDKVRRRASALTQVIGDGIRSIRLTTALATSIISASSRTERSGIGYARGVLKGTVETMSRRKGLRFTLYDAVFDSAVNCHLSPGQEDIMREAWGKSVCVTGWVGREMASGRPVSVTEVQEVRVISNAPPGAYKYARGILGQRAEKPEMTIRRFRDA
jgi:hypothetical protein